MSSGSFFSFTESQHEENAKAMLAKLHAQRCLKEPRDQHYASLRPPGPPTRKGWLQRFLKCSNSVQKEHDAPFISGLQQRKNELIFRDDLMTKYQPRHATKDLLWCPVLGQWFSDEELEGVYLFNPMYGKDTMNIVFDQSYQCSDLYSARNGFLVHYRIAEAFDSGKFVIVPDTKELPRVQRIWRAGFCKPRQYSIHIVDPKWSRLDDEIQIGTKTTWRELDGRRLKFRTKFRPKVQYLYFNYCFQLLNRAWQYRGLSTDVLDVELKKNLWISPGPFLPRNMLLALVEELGSKYSALLKGSKDSPGQIQNRYILLEVCALQISGWQCKSIESESESGDLVD